MIEILLTGTKSKFNQIKILQQIFAVFSANIIIYFFSIIDINVGSSKMKNLVIFRIKSYFMKAGIYQILE